MISSEHTFNAPDGKTYKIELTIHGADDMMHRIVAISCFVKEKGKRKFNKVYDFNSDYCNFRPLSLDDRGKFIFTTYKSLVPNFVDELRRAQTNLKAKADEWIMKEISIDEINSNLCTI